MEEDLNLAENINVTRCDMLVLNSNKQDSQSAACIDVVQKMETILVHHHDW